jgi:hypothetical protein
MLPICRIIFLIWGLFGLWNAHEETMGTQDQYKSVCMCNPSCYVPIPSHLGLNNLDFSGYNKT